jgi:hypothetical protein
MPMTPDDWAWYAARVRTITVDINTEHRMSVQVSALADMVRNAKKAIATASDASTRLNGSAQRVVQRVAEVEAMVNELNAAESELAIALGSTSNGGPPLDSGATTSPASVTSSVPTETIDSSIIKVQAANA